MFWPIEKRNKFLYKYRYCITFTASNLILTQNQKGEEKCFFCWILKNCLRRSQYWIFALLFIFTWDCVSRERIQKLLFTVQADSSRSKHLKGLSHEIDFKNVDENGQILALTRAAAGFWIFQRLLWFLIEIKHQFPGKCLNDAESLCSLINFVTELPASLLSCRLFQRKIEVQNFLWCAATLPDYYCTSVNTTWHTAGLIHDFLERAEPTPTFFTWYQYYADSE